ncbi:Ig-like domain-containing protein [Streptomyces sp. NPDC059443]|uniref:Ig-like domain-containing protein n=1 Tax=unclassified Streptomyces TaxID=2593676 RepID=UPI0036B6F565
MNLLCRGQALGNDPSLGAVYAALYSSADPRHGVATGETFQLALSVMPDRGASRGCAYLPGAPLTAVADILAVEGLEFFPRQGWFRARAEAGETVTGVVHLRVHDSVTAPLLRPQMVVGVPDASGRKLVRTGKLADAALVLRPPAARSLRALTEPGRPCTVNVLSAAPVGSRAVSVAQPRGGDTQLSHDGWVTYTPSPGFTGYDRFDYEVVTPAAAKLTSHVNVFVGSTAHAPGVFPQHTADVAFRPWQWPELSGEMPWPRPGPSARNR